ncbi:MAG: glutamate--tRNA ligase [Alphaproteobacteria bacterium]|nr:glutamate--tRNA ligase [Rickettsiales bacterium]
MTIITRFAPSPTGMLHIGGARTALFNYYFAKKNKGKFLLRIEDTDKKRSTVDAVLAIMLGMHWLGIEIDEEIVFQSNNAQQHIDIAKQLLDAGQAYESYERKITIGKESQIVKTEQPSIKIKIPKGKTIVKDTVHGTIEFNNDDIEDFVILRSTQEPTYMLSAVVDDINANVTNIIRGDDHLSNTPKQIILYQMLNKHIPQFTHIPLIHGMDGKKLSKRHNAVAVEEYQNKGYLPEAMQSYLMQLGWNPNLEKEILSPEEIEKVFNLKDINKSASKFNVSKLNHINLKYIQNMPDGKLFGKIKQHIVNHLANCCNGGNKQKYTAFQSQLKQVQIANIIKQNNYILTQLKHAFNNVKEANINILNIKTQIEQNNKKQQEALAQILSTNIKKSEEINNDEIEQKILNSLPECKKQNNLKDVAETTCLFLPHFEIQFEDDAIIAIKNNHDIVVKLKNFLNNFNKPVNEFQQEFKLFLTENNYKFGAVGPVLRSILIGKTSSINISFIIAIIELEEAKERAKKAILLYSNKL